MSTTQTGTKQTLRDYVDSLGLTYTATFQPKPQPKETVEHPQLHWLITLTNGKQSAQFPYSQGVGHIKGYRHTSYKTAYDKQQAEAYYRKTCETGKLFRQSSCGRAAGDFGFQVNGTQPAPDMLDVLYCLVSEASVRHASTYEEWAVEYGYDTDSRKGEAIYRACQKQTTDLLRALGGGKVGYDALKRLEKLEELFQGY